MDPRAAADPKAAPTPLAPQVTLEEPDLESCFPYAFRSLQEFRLGRYRQRINALPVAGMPEPYQSAFLEATQRIPRHERDEWLRSSPAVYNAYWAERDRLLRAQVPYRDVPSQAEQHIRSLLAAGQLSLGA